MTVRPAGSLAGAAASVALAIAAPAAAADHSNLEEDLPTAIEDAYTIGRGGRELQSLVRYERTDDGKDRIVLEPRIEAGLFDNMQAKIAVPFYLGTASRTDSGNIGLELLYNFNVEGILLPAFALAVRADLPTGTHSSGVDTTVKGIVTKSVTRRGLDRVHLNVAWAHNAGPLPDQRRDRYRLVAGYSRRLTADLMGVADFVREQDVEKGKDANIVEIGLRHQLTPLATLALGIAAGIGEESPDIRTTLGVQYSF